jgi:hypothetical protein
MLVRNAGNNLKVDTAYHPRRHESSNETVFKGNHSTALFGDLNVEEAVDLS